MSDPMEVKLTAYKVVDKIATAAGSSAHVFVPKEWVGKKVKVFLLEQVSENEKTQNKKANKRKKPITGKS
ncbi:MAG: DUF2080 family transposase-associated protein [Candidatus Bathyarchaeia archaeon]|jgi:putative transposon-encoded protein